MLSIGKDAFKGSSINNVIVRVINVSSFCSNKVIGCIYSSIGKPVQLIDNEGKEINEYVIPDSVTSIGNSAFRNCNGLTTVTIPNSITSIGSNAFAGTNALMIVKSYIAEPFNISKFSEDTYRQGTLFVPKGTKELYTRFDGWREFLNIVEMGDEPAPNGQCATPTIIVSGNKITFECDTPDAEFTSYLTSSEEISGNEVVIENKDITFTLTVYAIAPGYDRSKPATMKIIFKNGDMNLDGIVNLADITTLIKMIAGQK
jgi:hypothetical protein